MIFLEGTGFKKIYKNVFSKLSMHKVWNLLRYTIWNFLNQLLNTHKPNIFFKVNIFFICIGDHESTIIPSGYALRNLKGRQKHSDKLIALCIIKCEIEFKTAIRDIGLDPFFLHYHTGKQIKLCTCPQIITDATGWNIFHESKSFLQTRNNINPLYLSELIPYIIQLNLH